VAQLKKNDIILIVGIITFAILIAYVPSVLMACGLTLMLLGFTVLMYPKLLSIPIFEKLEKIKLRTYPRRYGILIIIVGFFLFAIWGGTLPQPPIAQIQASQNEKATPPKSTVQKKTNQQTNAPIEQLYKVAKVTDGDTFDVEINGKKETVRMLLVDTPETVHPNKPVQPFGKEASTFTTQLLNGKSVKLEADKEDKDQYGRLLRYVYIDGKSVQEQLLEKGLARVSAYQPNTKYVAKYQQIETGAKNKKIAIWSIANYVQASGFVTPTPKPVSKPVQKPTPKPAPKPEPKPKQETQPEPETNYVYYANCSEAKSAGAAPLYEGDPGYRSKLDRDKDGVACE
jgi:micrococcal nuclease